MWQLLKTINQHLVMAIPAMMLAGFGFGLAFDPTILKSLIVPLTFVMVYPMMVALKIKEVFKGGDSRAQLLAQLINFGIVPFAAYGVGLYFLQAQPYLALGLLLAGLVPTSGMTISWTGLARGNMVAAVKMTVIGLTLGSLATPLYVQFLLGAQIEVNIAAVVRQILLIVFLPMAAGFATQQLLIGKFGRQTFQKDIGPKFPGVSLITERIFGKPLAAGNQPPKQSCLPVAARQASSALVQNSLNPCAYIHSVGYDRSKTKPSFQQSTQKGANNCDAVYS